ncbi:DNA/RNA helicase domain-containing protein [Halomarina rubra]|uniref:DNA/RNA helicase domain-containing protein n=1 Tax=Halomarina rubra TaxID=2071873 RepID=A0ABD6AZW7_9EURY|nr:DNA/RNA helicase domain-containing protein [Halomarina rubra]
MLVYENTKAGLLDDVLNDRLVAEIKKGHADQGLAVGSDSEVRSWENSFQYVYKVLASSDIPDDAGIAVEFKIPLTSRRVDLIISGYDEAGNANAIIVELKQWEGESTQAVAHKDGIIETYLGNDIRETTHPCYQAWSYTQFLEDFNQYIQETPVDLHPIAYLHNYEPEAREELEHEAYQQYTDEVPLFLRGEVAQLSAFLESKIQVGDGGEILQNIDASPLTPSKSLQDAILEMLEGNNEFTLIDSQKVVYEKALELAAQSQQDDQKRVLIVEGGPGTGKTVVAINILVELLQQDLTAQYVSKNSAPRDVYEQKLRGDMLVKDINHLFTGAGSYVDEEPNTLDALIADEAHRLNEKSNFFGHGENQIMEIINAAQFSVFFIDETQRVHIKDIGSIDEIEKHAAELGAEVTKRSLTSQLRCAGSEDYIDWLEDVLDIRELAVPMEEDVKYDVRVFDSPQELHDAIEARNEDGRLSRVVAGYCWDWEKESKPDAESMDITIGDYERSWNLEANDPWAIAEGSVDQVGCIHTSQGLEFDYVGVIIGDDLRYEDGELVTDHEARASADRSVHGMKKMTKERPDDARELADEIIKNTYRTLMTRGMKGCYIYCCDDDLQEYMRSRVAEITSGDATVELPQ